eukprot:TRINITY_DN10419_c0_g2_i1.p2 TRINITY_DN10419_c0_g2~~TRINITY_DN10419_c0_g2_i1.p2  ORF type:complete len:161 (+),score=46.65 TRINITY_DN10419_c0_g2_i1:41-523(+)
MSQQGNLNLDSNNKSDEDMENSNPNMSPNLSPPSETPFFASSQIIVDQVSLDLHGKVPPDEASDVTEDAPDRKPHDEESNELDEEESERLDMGKALDLNTPSPDAPDLLNTGMRNSKGDLKMENCTSNSELIQTKMQMFKMKKGGGGGDGKEVERLSGVE